MFRSRICGGGFFMCHSLENPVYLLLFCVKMRTNVRFGGESEMDNRNRDRGTIKWTSLMLPEHVEMIKNLWKEDERVEKGIIDEQKAAEVDFLLQRAWKDDLTVKARVHNGFDYEDVILKLKQLNKAERRVNAINWKTKEPYSFRLDDLADLAIL